MLIYCISLFSQGNDAGETLSFHANELTLPRHESIHRELEVYAELMHWMKAMDRKAYTALMRVYTGAISKLYDRDIKQFFEEAKLRISGFRDKKGDSTLHLYIISEHMSSLFT